MKTRSSTSPVKPKRRSLNPFKKRSKKHTFTGEDEEVVDEELIAVDDINESKKGKSFFSKGKSSSPKSMGATVVVSEQDVDDDDDDEILREKSAKLENAEMFIAEKIEKLNSTSKVNGAGIRTIDIQATESKAQNDNSTRLFNSNGVMMFDGMDDDKNVEDEECEEKTKKDPTNDKSNQNKEKNLNFVKAPEKYDPVASGFYKPKKRDALTYDTDDDEDEDEDEVYEKEVREKEAYQNKRDEKEIEVSNEVVDSNGLCCALWN